MLQECNAVFRDPWDVSRCHKSHGSAGDVDRALSGFLRNGSLHLKPYGRGARARLGGAADQEEEDNDDDDNDDDVASISADYSIRGALRRMFKRILQLLRITA